MALIIRNDVLQIMVVVRTISTLPGCLDGSNDLELSGDCWEFVHHLQNGLRAEERRLISNYDIILLSKLQFTRLCVYCVNRGTMTCNCQNIRCNVVSAFRPGSAHSLHAFVSTGSCNLLGHLDDGLTLLGDETGCLYELLLGVQFSTLTSAGRERGSKGEREVFL